MKKIIILAYDFPPINSVGAQRPYSWFKFFKKNGLYPIVITRNWNKNSNELIQQQEEYGDIYYSNYKENIRDRILLKYGANKFKIIRKFLSISIHITQYFTKTFDSKHNIYKTAESLINKNNIDYIIATGEPFILFKYAHLLSKKHKIPWFADYRDDWIFNHSRLHKGFYDKLLRKYEAFFEKKYLSNVKGIISVSNYIVKNISHRVNSENYINIENGVDLDYVNSSSKILDQNNFNIVYTGILYDCSYIEIFSKGFTKFISTIKNKNIKVYFVGIEKQKFKSYYDVLSLKKKFPNNIEIVNQVDIQTAINYQLSGHVLLNFIAGDPSKGLIGAKAYSYATTRNPTLVIPEIANKNSPFFPNRDIQKIATNEDEVFEFLFQKFKLFNSSKDYYTSITQEEIFSLSREYNSIRLAKFILK